MPDRDEKKFRKLLADIVCDYCPHSEGYCLYKEILVANGISERLLLQFKLVEIFKLQKSQEQNREIKWPEAWMMWNDLNYAAKFAKIYDESPDLEYKEMYKRILK